MKFGVMTRSGPTKNAIENDSDRTTLSTTFHLMSYFGKSIYG